MNKEYWLELLQKAGWAAFYGGLAEFVATQSLDKDTILVALLGSLARSGIVFFTSIWSQLKEDFPITAGRNRKTWRNNL